MLLYAIAARMSLLIAIPGTNISPFWLPSGIAISICAIYGLRFAPAIALGAFAANVQILHEIHHALSWTDACVAGLTATGNCLEAVVAANLLRGGIHKEIAPLDSLWRVFCFFLIILGSCVISAGNGITALALNGYLPADKYAESLWTWWLGDVIGALLVVPLAIAWLGPQLPVKRRPAWRASSLLTAVFAGFCICLFAFADNSPAFRLGVFLVFPFLAAFALLGGHRSTALATVIVAACAVMGTLRGTGPFATRAIMDSLVLLDTFVAFFCAVGLTFAVDATERSLRLNRTLLARISAPWAALLGSAAVTLVVWVLVGLDMKREIMARFEGQGRQVEWRIQSRIGQYEGELRSAASLFESSDKVTRETWNSFLQSLDPTRNFPGVLGIGYAPRVDRVSSKAYEGDFDPLSDPALLSTLAQARDSGGPALSHRIHLRTTPGADRKVLLLVIPVYKRNDPLTSVESRRAALRGFVYSPIDPQVLIPGILRDEWPQVRVELYEGDDAAMEALLYAAPAIPSALGANRPPRASDRTMRLFGRNFVLHVIATDAFESTIDRQKPQMVFLGGALLSLIIFAVVRTQFVTSERAQRLARRMTRELAQSEERYRSLYEQTPAMLHSIDPNGKLLAVSDAWLRNLGYRREEVLGRASVEFLTPPSRECAGTAVIPEFFRTGHCREVSCQMMRKDGSVIDVLVSGVVLAGDRPQSLAYIEDVTERKKAEREAVAARAKEREAIERLAGIVEFSGEAIVSQTLNEEIVTWNRGAAELFGYETHQVIGASMKILLPADRIEEEKVLVGRVRNGEVLRQFETVRVRRDGTRIDVAVTLSPIRNAQGELVGISNVVHDITAHRMLLEMRARQAAVLQSAGVSIISTDERGLITSANREAERMLGYDASELAGLPVFQSIHNREELLEHAARLTSETGAYVAPNQEALFHKARTGAVDQREWTYARKDGSEFPACVSISAIRKNENNISGFTCVAIDISASKANERLQTSAIQMKELLLQEVYHRVKNNLQVISSLFNLQLQFLAPGAASEVLRQSAERVRAMALVHEKLCNSDTKETLDVVAYVRELCSSLGAAYGASPRGIHVRTRIEQIPIALDSAIPLGLLLNELVCNSLKHGFPGNRTGSVWVTLQGEANRMVMLTVEDDGVGFAGTDPGYIGSLGLQLVTTLARQLGGSLSMNGEHGAKCVLRFSLDAGVRAARSTLAGEQDCTPPARRVNALT
jgi:PAS domain S-box-containing protein